MPEWSVYTSFFLFLIPGSNFLPVFLIGMSSPQDEISSRQKRVNSKRHFTIDKDDFIPRQVLSRDEISRVNTLIFIKYLWNIWSCYLKFWFNRSLNHCIRFLHNYFDNLFYYFLYKHWGYLINQKNSFFRLQNWKYHWHSVWW